MSTSNTEPLEIELLRRRVNVLEEEIQRRIVEKREVCSALGVDWQNVVNLGQVVAARVGTAPAHSPFFEGLKQLNTLRRLKLPNVRSGAHALCLRCGFEGVVYGTPNMSGVSHPWCSRCESNMGLIEIEKAGPDDQAPEPPKAQTPARPLVQVYKFTKTYVVDNQPWFEYGQHVLVFDNEQLGILRIDNTNLAIVPKAFPPTGWDGVCLSADALLQHGYIEPVDAPAHQHASYEQFYMFVAKHCGDHANRLPQPQGRPLTWNDR